jgi:hypothetical protein
MYIVAESIYMLHYISGFDKHYTVDQVPAASFKRNMFDSCWVERKWGKSLLINQIMRGYFPRRRLQVGIV